MSGAEATAVLGVISSIISIIDGTKKVYDTATNARGLPEAFREVADRLPIIEEILDSAKQHIGERKVDDDSCKGVKHTVEACEEKAKKLEELFRKAIPSDGASDLKRYYKAVKALGKGSGVEKLMKGMLEDLQLLACEHGMKTATGAQQEQIVKAITEVSAISPSVPENEFQETGFTNKNYGTGTQNNAQGENIAQGSARQYMSGGGTMNFGQTFFDVTTNSFSVPEGPNGDEAQACLSALFLTDPRDDRAKLISTKGARVDGTCQWIKDHVLYDSWLRSHSQLLWLSGGPGKGKTMLSIFLAEELEQTAGPSQNKLLLQYFCDNKDAKRNTAVTILRGLIYQLLQFRQELINHILPTFRIQKDAMFSSFEPLWRIFEKMVCDPTLETTYCVLDGLDECDEASLAVLLRRFAALLSGKTIESSVCHLNLLIVSRDRPDCIPDLLSSFLRISLDPDTDTEIDNDIDFFIKAKVEELSRRKQYPELLRMHVQDVFRHRAQGTFLWIGIVAQVLEKYKVTEVEKALDLFPPGLDQLYARILLQIDSGRRELAARILRWVVMAVRPLTLSELSIAIETTAEPSTVALGSDQRIRDQVSYCGNLLKIKKDEVGLIHQSAKDYLLRKTCDSNPELEFFRVKEEVANLEIARRCLDYLHTGALEEKEPPLLEKEPLLKNVDHLKAFPLLSYAALHWYEHARFLARSADIFDLSHPFFHQKSPIRLSWLKAYWAREHFRMKPPESFTLLHLASYFGILPLAENLVLTKDWIEKMKRKIKRPYYLDKPDEAGMTALMRAAENGHETVVRLLLDNKASIEAEEGTALGLVARSGHEALVRLLLEKGANIEARGPGQQTALISAAYSGHENIVRLLLEKGANIEARIFDQASGLTYAADSGHWDIVRLLVEKGANIEAHGIGEQQTAMMTAIICGHEDTVRLLVEKGANVEARDFCQRTALKHAAEMDNSDIVRLLLEKGANIEAQDLDQRTALIEAAGLGHEATVLLLLEKGANIEAKDSDQKTALILTAEKGHEAIVLLLLEKGANIEAKDSDQKTALILTAEKGHEAIVRLLLEKKANIEAQNYHQSTALLYAANEGYEVIVRLLLGEGANIEARNNLRRTALLYAAEGGHEATVRLLLEKGADSDARDKHGETALMKAEKGRREYEGKKPSRDEWWRVWEAEKLHQHEATVQLLSPSP